jgi:excinuclease ABC subunit C
MVVRDGGGPKKSDYRHFRILSTSGPDDFLAMREVVTRHYKKLRDNGSPMPDLVLIDGGKGQVSMAVRAFAELGISDDERPPIIGLAKERGEKFERIFVPGRKNPIVLKPAAPATRIVQQVRDEAHRFAVSYHRKLRSLKIRDSELDAIPGIGKARKTALLTTFGSVEGIKKATLEEIAACPRMTGASAEAVWSALQPAPEPDATKNDTKPVRGGLVLTRQQTKKQQTN